MVAPGRDWKAVGELYIGGGESLRQKGVTYIHFGYEQGVLNARGDFEYETKVGVERVVFLGPGGPKTLGSGFKLTKEFMIRLE